VVEVTKIAPNSTRDEDILKMVSFDAPDTEALLIFICTVATTSICIQLMQARPRWVGGTNEVGRRTACFSCAAKGQISVSLFIIALESAIILSFAK